MNNQFQNKSILPEAGRVRELEKKASSIVARLLPKIGKERMEEFIAEQTDDTMLEGAKIGSEGELDFSVPEDRFFKLPPLWLKLAEKFLEQLIAGLEQMASTAAPEEFEVVDPVINVTSETKEMMVNLGLGALLTKGLIKNMEMELVAKDGVVQPVNVAASVLRDKAGSIQGMVITAKDLSELQKLQKEKLEVVEKSKEEAEKLVRQRTVELEEKVLELERFNKLAVGRELKMIELKEEIARIKNIKT